MANRSELLDKIKWLFEKLLNQRDGTNWIESDLGRCADLIVTLSDNNVDESYEYYAELAFYYSKQVEKRIEQKLVAQRRRHDHQQNFKSVDWLGAVNYFNYRCAYCGASDSLTVDHFIPFSKGGELVKENIIPACTRCNSSKNNRNFEGWFETQEFYDEEQKQKIYEFLEK